MKSCLEDTKQQIPCNKVLDRCHRQQIVSGVDNGAVVKTHLCQSVLSSPLQLLGLLASCLVPLSLCHLVQVKAAQRNVVSPPCMVHSMCTPHMCSMLACSDTELVQHTNSQMMSFVASSIAHP